MKRFDRQLHVCLTPVDVQRVKELAETREVSISGLIRGLLREAHRTTVEKTNRDVSIDLAVTDVSTH
jgi:hypothetical protein